MNENRFFKIFKKKWNLKRKYRRTKIKKSKKNKKEIKYQKFEVFSSHVVDLAILKTDFRKKKSSDGMSQYTAKK